jgi:hypothetical protein
VKRKSADLSIPFAMVTVYPDIQNWVLKIFFKRMLMDIGSAKWTGTDCFLSPPLFNAVKSENVFSLLSAFENNRITHDLKANSASMIFRKLSLEEMWWTALS